ncbi:MAG: hypothetical protein GOVbin1678_55 [Prokaryotic dsDNA virus sp.]|jgi:hypothetical protein|nr:MAG: hypothetical protein GOVbin1678_55 [Prokaryotic dsDNA virus sp.]|tara:strand:+ start:27436 stop:27837 length:402 start_codon:yes stop_codon:yes gene_type:complete
MKDKGVNNNLFISRLLEDIIIEKHQQKPDKFFIQQCQALMDEELLDFKSFLDTGRITLRNEFSFLYPKQKLHKKTQSVLRYAGGFYIEILQNAGEKIWKVKSRRYKSIGKAEKRLWESEILTLKQESNEKRDI